MYPLPTRFFFPKEKMRIHPFFFRRKKKGRRKKIRRKKLRPLCGAKGKGSKQEERGVKKSFEFFLEEVKTKKTKIFD